MEIDLERIVRFYHVAEGLSFVKAAQKLNVDQTWLSRQIQQLETQLGCLLLERSTRHVTLTPEGLELFESAQTLAEAAKRARTVARSLGVAKRRELALGISNTTFWIPARQCLIETAAARHPEVTVNTVVRNSTEVIRDLQERNVDICIAGIGENMDRFEYVTIHRSRPLLLVPEEHPLATANQVSMADLAGVDLAVPVVDNNFSFEQIYGPFVNSGAVIRWVSEGPLAAMHLAASHRYCLVGWGYENVVSSTLVLREVCDSDAHIDVVVARNIGDDREAVRKFWASALLVAKQFESSFA
jgi:DNA-binding transcriptional LysR family regulator